MRELTRKEIDNAPSWATRYFIAKNYGIRWSNSEKYKWQGDESIYISGGYLRRINSESVLIPRKEFDISKHVFTDCDIELVEVDGLADDEYLHFDFKQETNELTHSKGDVIAMAKALKITAEDLL